MKSDRIFFNFFPALEDLTKVSTYDWGRFTLEWMYSNMSKVVNREKAVFLGLHFYGRLVLNTFLFNLKLVYFSRFI